MGSCETSFMLLSRVHWMVGPRLFICSLVEVFFIEILREEKGCEKVSLATKTHPQTLTRSLSKTPFFFPQPLPVKTPFLSSKALSKRPLLSEEQGVLSPCPRLVSELREAEP